MPTLKIEDKTITLKPVVEVPASFLKELGEAVAYYAPVAFESGLSVTDSRFTVSEGGLIYSAKGDLVPFTTTATFDPDNWNLVISSETLFTQSLNRTDAEKAQALANIAVDGPRTASRAQAMRDNLSDGDTFLMGGLRYVVDSSATSASVTSDIGVIGLSPFGSVSPQHFGADPDAVTAQDAFFTALEASHENSIIDLQGATYAVDALPKSNRYVNGRFLVDGVYYATKTSYELLDGPLLGHFGNGQLSGLKKKLNDQLVQEVQVVLADDSTGHGAAALGYVNPNTALARNQAFDADNFASNSMWNLFVRAVGEAWSGNNTPTIANRDYSTSGEAKITYTKTTQIFPNGSRFTVNSLSDAPQSDTNAATHPLAKRLNIRVNSTQPAGFKEWSFPFKGRSIRMLFAAAPNGLAYEIFADGISTGVVQETDMNALSAAFNQNMAVDHTFPYFEGTLTIRWRRSTVNNTSVNQSGWFNGIELDRKLIFTNYSISGASLISWMDDMQVSPPSGQTPAIKPEHDLCLLGLTLNSRGNRAVEAANGANQPQNWKAASSTRYYDEVVDALAVLTPITDVALLTPNNAYALLDEDGGTTTIFDAREGAEVVRNVAVTEGVDMIDMFALYNIPNWEATLASDLLHPVLSHEDKARMLAKAVYLA